MTYIRIFLQSLQPILFHLSSTHLYKLTTVETKAPAVRIEWEAIVVLVLHKSSSQQENVQSPPASVITRHDDST